jgi:hypothetical protein
MKKPDGADEREEKPGVVQVHAESIEIHRVIKAPF